MPSQGLGQPRTVMVVGVLEEQGLFAKSLCGETKALRGDGDMGMRHTPAPCKSFWESVCPLVGVKEDAGGDQEQVGCCGKVQFSSKR